VLWLALGLACSASVQARSGLLVGPSAPVAWMAVGAGHLAPGINEFMADNSSTLIDGDGQYSDWIELYNPHDEDISLSGYYLTDDIANPTRWSFPEGTQLASGAYLVVMASGQSEAAYVDPAGFLHTTFSLARDGEYLALVAPDGVTILQEFAPRFPQQYSDISYSEEGYFTTPTPGAANSPAAVPGFVAETRFEPERGVYPNERYPESVLEVAVTTDTIGASIYYTTDGSEPTPQHGRLYTAPIPIATTTVLRAVAYKDRYVPSNVDTHTYLFPADVMYQDNAPAGYPTDWAGHPADYEMDPEVVNDPCYADDMEQSLHVFPSLSIACDRDALFGADGLYQNPKGQGSAWERAVSAELIVPDGSEPGFQIDAGLRIQGGSSRNPDTPKHSFSLRFRKEYGAAKLDYPLFRDAPSGETAVESFDFLQLRACYNFGWMHRHYYQCRHSQYNRDQWTNDLFLAMGQPGSHGRWVHLYLNGLYWGLYHLHERPDKDFMASYFGGDPEQYDVLNSGSATDGNKNAWNAMIAIAKGNIADPGEYARIQEYLNIDSIIDYFILNCYIGNRDWDGHNWRAGRQRIPGAQYRMFPWDSEFAISPNGPGVVNNPAPLTSTLNINRTSLNGQNRPSGLHQSLTRNAEYRTRFADRLHKHLFQDGALTPEAAGAIWRNRSDLMDRAIIAESARWGDFRRDIEAPHWPQANFDLYTRDDHYLPDQAYILQTYIPQRTAIVLAQFRARNLYPSLEAPVYAQPGGAVPRGFALSIQHPNAGCAIYYTLDGTDPRQASATESDLLLDASAPAAALVPTDGSLGTTWTDLRFSDRTWLQGQTGIGYERSSTYTSLIGLDVEQAYGNNATVYLRIPFQIADRTQFDEIQTLSLNMKYDDGFVAYINGFEVASAQAPPAPTWNSQATAGHADAAALVYEAFDISGAIGALRVGNNVLAIHLLNTSATSSDLLAVPQLSYADRASSPISPGAIPYTAPATLTQTGPVRARALDNNQWSALAETFFIVGTPARAGNLLISELFYNPPGSAEDTEFVELLNISPAETIDLTGVRFDAGIDFAFAPGTTLEPGERLLIVADPAAFAAEYGPDLPVAGQFQGRLDNGGETLRLVAHDGTDIEAFAYDDKFPWPESADGQGDSLTRIASEQNLDPQAPENWTSSDTPGGTPGW